ncbi:hypothetical protein [Mycolicibacterium sp.]|uniref:DUF7937 domain-containing protein n=1 Tax=Mycolicibacterium sp. TaxID=2320850 RepID=UPI0037C56A1F
MNNLENGREAGITNVIRDAIAAVLLVLGLLLPWNIRFGIGVTGTSGWVFGVLVVATLSALAAAAAGHVTALPARLRNLLTVPYLVVVAGFVGFTIVQSVRYGGSGSVPPGIGPGVWAGAAGAVLAAQPVPTEPADDERHGARGSRIVGLVSLVLAVAAVLFNLYWRTRFVLPNVTDADTGTQNLSVVIGAILYGAVALIPVLFAARWMMSADRAPRLATVLLAAAALTAGVVVWVLPIGRELDAFHGIAQNTSTAGVGFEGYLAWAVAAAIIGPATIRGAVESPESWRGAARKCLLLIAIWCAGTATLRMFDLLSAAVLDLPAPPYNSTALMAFDLVAAVLAMWLFINGAGAAAPKSVVVLLFGVLFVMTVSRVILGVALVPRSQPLSPTDINEVYGNTLSQQITSTFDVALCVLSLVLLTVLLVLGIRKPRRSVGSAPETVVLTDVPVERAEISGAPQTVRIARPAPRVPESPQDRVAEVLAQSTRRFAAGTTYGGPDSGKSGQGVTSGR